MNTEPTIPQGGNQQRAAQEKSLRSTRPPIEVPGYEAERFLGVGAFGEVWVAIDRNTGRRVAIKYYAHRGGLDWSLLSREVEKLAFLFGDRYAVQLIGVGWDSDPPYYVMEYFESGSLADRLRTSRLTVAEAVEMFHDIAVGLMHAHGKGVLHCDLKPGNILLDQDHSPRLADFGQSRLSTDQTPALGTLFYMAPEQANLTATPDARWDVYALGALFYCMLTGTPPYRTAEADQRLEGLTDLNKRLSTYRHIIRKSHAPVDHYRIAGVDRALADIIDRCIAADPAKRFPNVQAVLDALNARDARRARRPTMVLGVIAPALVLLIVFFFAWQGFGNLLRHSNDLLLNQALQSTEYAARYVARSVAGGLDRRYRAIEKVAASEVLRREFEATVADPEMAEMLKTLAAPDFDPTKQSKLLETFRNHPRRRALQQALFDVAPASTAAGDNVNSWYLNDARGVQLARVPEASKVSTVGLNYAWRTYFSGLEQDKPKTWRPKSPRQHIVETQLSAAYQSEATHIWNVAISTPILGGEENQQFHGIAGLTVGVGALVELNDRERQFAVLVETPTKETPGRILQHPVFSQRIEAENELPTGFSNLLLDRQDFPDTPATKADYHDPLAKEDTSYAKRWLAEAVPVSIGGQDTGWSVIVQESYDNAIGMTLASLRSGMARYGLATLAVVVAVVLALWAVAFRLLSRATPTRFFASSGAGTELSSPGTGLTPMSASTAPTEAHQDEA